MGTSRINFFSYLLLFFFLSSTQLLAQRTVIDKAGILPGDDILFLSGLETENRSVTDTTAKDIFYQYLDEEGAVRDTFIARHMIVKAYKNVEGRRRLDTFQKGTKVRWKQYGKRREGFVELYSAAKEKIDIMVYTDTLIEKIPIPVQYLSPFYGDPSRSDTIKMISQIWEADEPLLMFPIQDSIEECFPLTEKMTFTPSYKEKKVQYIFKESKFALLMTDDLETGIIGSWKLSGDQIHITTMVAALPPDEDGEKGNLRCAATYIYEFAIKDEGNSLSFSHVGPLPYVPEPEPEPIPEIDPEIDSESTIGGQTPPVKIDPNKYKGKLHPFWRDKY